jgi:hypothetical protein
MTNSIKKINFLEAESMALNLAYKQFFGEKNPIGIAFTFITDRKNGNEWSESEKQAAKYISQQAISDLKRKNLIGFIMDGLVPDCLMARRFMATGSGQTALGYNF